MIPLNQFQVNYAFHPTNFTHLPQESHSFQGLMNAPLFPFETQTSTSSKKKGRKKKSFFQTKDSEPPQPVRRNWTKEGDVALTKAWLHISIDPIVGIDQPADTLWGRIHPVWKEFLADDFVEERSLRGLSKRWCTIQGAINKFQGIYEQLARSPRSGTNLDDLKREAHKVYKETSSDNIPFMYEQCWGECIKNAEWYSLKRQKSNSGTLSTSNSSSIQNENQPIDVDTPEMECNNVDGIVRPLGRKTSKDKKKMQCQDKIMVDILANLQGSLQQQFNHNQEELGLKRESVLTMKEYELREHAMKKELEFKEKELALKAKAQRRRDQQKILNQDLSKLTLAAFEVMEKIQARILKEWEEEDFGFST